jgi:hypothetical protein
MPPVDCAVARDARGLTGARLALDFLGALRQVSDVGDLPARDTEERALRAADEVAEVGDASGLRALRHAVVGAGLLVHRALAGLDVGRSLREARLVRSTLVCH